MLIGVEPLEHTYPFLIEIRFVSPPAIDDVLSLREVPGNSSYEQDDGNPSFYRIFGKRPLLHKKNETVPPEPGSQVFWQLARLDLDKVAALPDRRWLVAVQERLR